MYRFVIFTALIFTFSCGDKNEFPDEKDFEVTDYQLLNIDYGLHHPSHDFAIPSFEHLDYK